MTLYSNGLFRLWTASGCIDNAERKPASPSVPQRKHLFSVLRFILIGTLATLSIFVLSSCGSLRISQADRKLISEGKKSLLVTQNPGLLDFAALIPIEILIGVFDDEGTVSHDIIEVDIEKIDGNEVDEEWFRANEEVAVEPGIHQIEATYTVRNRTKNSSSCESDTQTINYSFEGGKRYRMYVLEHFDWYEICIGPY